MTKRKPRELHSYARRVDVEELTRLHRAGMPQPQMAEHFGVHRRTISRNLKELGLTKPAREPGKRVTEEWKARAEQLLNEGASLIEVARTTDVSYCTVTRYFPGRGWDSTTSGQHAYAVRKANRELSRIGHSPLNPTSVGLAA